MTTTSDNMEDHLTYIQRALDAAQEAFDRDEVPIGAVVVHAESGEIIAVQSNRTRELNDPTAHAEILALREACKKAGAQRIPEMNLYVTLEPCPMCASAISFARIGTVYFGAKDEKSGGICHGPEMYTQKVLHHKPKIVSGLLENECGNILKTFFKSKRK